MPQLEEENPSLGHQRKQLNTVVVTAQNIVEQKGPMKMYDKVN